MEKNISRITKCVRKADIIFQKVGGSSRHWVRDCFIPALVEEGLMITENEPCIMCRGCQQECKLRKRIEEEITETKSLRDYIEAWPDGRETTKVQIGLLHKKLALQWVLEQMEELC